MTAGPFQVGHHHPLGSLELGCQRSFDPKRILRLRPPRRELRQPFQADGLPPGRPRAQGKTDAPHSYRKPTDN